MPNEILLFILTGLIGFVAKLSYDLICKRNKDHQLVRKLPDIFERHAKEHVNIISDLDVLRMANLSQVKSRLVEMYNRAIKNGYMTVYEMESWYSLYEAYSKLGGNGFMESLKEQVDEIPTR